MRIKCTSRTANSLLHYPFVYQGNAGYVQSKTLQLHINTQRHCCMKAGATAELGKHPIKWKI